MTDYTHPLDPWGNSMLGVDVGGKVCFWGSTGYQDNQETDGAYQFCSKIYGYPGPNLLLDGGPVPGFSVDGRLVNFKACRFFTHNSVMTVKWLSTPGVLNADGTTDGGCRDVQNIPKDDPDGVCPTGEMANDAFALALGLGLGLGIPLLLCCICICAKIFRKKAPEGEAKAKTVEITAAPAAEPSAEAPAAEPSAEAPAAEKV